MLREAKRLHPGNAKVLVALLQLCELVATHSDEGIGAARLANCLFAVTDDLVCRIALGLANQLIQAIPAQALLVE